MQILYEPKLIRYCHSIETYHQRNKKTEKILPNEKRTGFIGFWVKSAQK